MEAQLNYGPNIARQKKWKIVFISLSIFIVLFYIIGGALIGASVGCAGSQWAIPGSWSAGIYIPATSGGSAGGGNCSSKWQGGAALVSLASIAIVPWIVFLVLRFTRWYHGQVATSAAAAVQVPSANQPVTTEQKAADAQPPTASLLCSNCEQPVSGAFCGNCGSKQL